jgi:hypothetical protein
MRHDLGRNPPIEPTIGEVRARFQRSMS